MKFLFYSCLFIVISCGRLEKQNKSLSKEKFLKTVRIDSLVFDANENAFFDKFGEGGGSLYKFDDSDMLSFYCFLNGKAYPYAEYFNEEGEIVRTEGHPSLRNQYEVNNDSSYTFSFMYSTFRKSHFNIQSITSTGDTLNNGLLRARDFSNVGGFSLIVKTKQDVLQTKIINHISFFDSIQKKTCKYSDTINLKDVIRN